jgi:hypothetical protein
MARWHSCNVLQAEKDLRQLWQFSASGNRFALQRQEAKLPNEPLNPKLIGKDWQHLVQPKLNVAWLPAQQVFLRALQLPKADPAETQSMVELQLEKLSPVPVTQAVWTFELMPTAAADLQTAVVIIVARSVVEEFLGQLEGQGYLADRLELPLLDQLRATEIRANGLWVYPGVGPDPWSCLVAWWYEGTLHNLSLLHLPASESRGQALQEQFSQMAWSGELEGWLTSPPRYHLVADSETAAAWVPLFLPEQQVEVLPPVPLPELAAMTARRAAAANGAVASLLPPEYSARYRQQFIDRLWMRGIGGVLLVYVFGVLIYFALIEFAKWRLGNVQDQLASLGQSYTNTLQMKEQVKVLQDQLDLQYAALDCYKAIAESLPEELTLDSLNFERGRRITLFGTASTSDSPKVQEFNEALRQAKAKDQPLFAKIQAPSINQRPGNQVSWNFWCDLKRTEND